MVADPSSTERVRIVSGRSDVLVDLATASAGRFQVERVDASAIDAVTGGLLVIDAASVPDAGALGRRWKAAAAGEFIVVVPDDRVGLDLLRAGAFDYAVWPFADRDAVAAMLQAVLRSTAPAARVELPQTIAGCRRTRLLGIGGMATAHLATRESDGAQVVLKVLNAELAADPDLVEHFLVEAQLSKSIEHPNIVRVLESGLDRGGFHLVLEWVDGWDLQTIGNALAWKIPPTIACAIVAEIAAALQYAHSRLGPDGKPLGIIHRDVNPPNVLVSRTGDVKLTDFGIAKTAQRFGRTRSGVLKGKVDYMSPEQLLAGTVDQRADVFALGTMLFELVAGTHPFRGSTVLQTMKRVKQGGPKTPSATHPRIPIDLDPILARALARNPVERHQTAGELERDLRAWIDRAGGVTRAEIAALANRAFAARGAGNARELTTDEGEGLPGVLPRTERARALERGAATGDDRTEMQAHRPRGNIARIGEPGPPSPPAAGDGTATQPSVPRPAPLPAAAAKPEPPPTPPPPPAEASRSVTMPRESKLSWFGRRALFVAGVAVLAWAIEVGLTHLLAHAP